MNRNMIALIKQFIFSKPCFSVDLIPNVQLPLLTKLSKLPGVCLVSSKIHTVQFVFLKNPVSVTAYLVAEWSIIATVPSMFPRHCMAHIVAWEKNRLGPLTLKEKSSVCCCGLTRVECRVLTVVTICRVWLKKKTRFLSSAVEGWWIFIWGINNPPTNTQLYLKPSCVSELPPGACEMCGDRPAPIHPTCDTSVSKCVMVQPTSMANQMLLHQTEAHNT